MEKDKESTMKEIKYNGLTYYETEKEQPYIKVMPQPMPKYDR